MTDKAAPARFAADVALAVEGAFATARRRAARRAAAGPAVPQPRLLAARRRPPRRASPRAAVHPRPGEGLEPHRRPAAGRASATWPGSAARCSPGPRGCGCSWRCDRSPTSDGRGRPRRSSGRCSPRWSSVWPAWPRSPPCPGRPGGRTGSFSASPCWRRFPSPACSAPTCSRSTSHSPGCRWCRAGSCRRRHWRTGKGSSGSASTPRGRLTIYPVVVDRVCHDWALDAPDGVDGRTGSARPEWAGEPPRPYLVEAPIVVERAPAPPTVEATVESSRAQPAASS